MRRSGPVTPVLPARLAAVLAVVIIGILTGGAPALAASPTQDSGGSASTWSLTGGSGGPLSVVDRNDYDEQSGTPQEVRSDSGNGRALQFSVPGGEKRSEVRPRVPRATEGTVQDVTYSARLDRSFPADADGWQIILQWHQSSDDGSPPVAVEINKGRLLLDNGETHQTEIGQVKAGDTVNLRLRVHFSKDTDSSSVDVWNGGRQVLTGYKPPEGTLQADGRNYMKVGIYRSESIDSDARLTLDRLDVATNPSSSDPFGTGPTSSGSGLLPVAAAVLLVVVGGLVVVVLVRRARSREHSR